MIRICMSCQRFSFFCESRSKPLKRFKQEIDLIRIVLQKETLQWRISWRGVLEWRQEDLLGRAEWCRRVGCLQLETWIPIAAHLFILQVFLRLSLLLSLHGLSFLPPTLNIFSTSEMLTLVLLYKSHLWFTQPSSCLKMLSFFH